MSLIVSLFILLLTKVSFAERVMDIDKQLKPYEKANMIERQQNTLYMKLKDGIVVIRMYPEEAPEHVERIKTLVRQGFYNGLTFHRVIKDFMAQTGDPTGTGAGKSDLPDLYAEFTARPHTRGTVSMARAKDPDSANSQFFIVTKDSQFLDGQYTAWGTVVEGMEYVDKIKTGSSKDNGMVKNPDKIIWIKIAYDEEIKNKDKKTTALQKFKDEISKIKLPSSGLELLGLDKKD